MDGAPLVTACGLGASTDGRWGGTLFCQRDGRNFPFFAFPSLPFPSLPFPSLPFPYGGAAAPVSSWGRGPCAHPHPTPCHAPPPAPWPSPFAVASSRILSSTERPAGAGRSHAGPPRTAPLHTAPVTSARVVSCPPAPPSTHTVRCTSAGIAGFSLYSNMIYNYSTIPLAISTTMLILQGDFDYQAMKDTQPLLTFVYFASFAMFGLFVLVNFIVSIFSGAFGAENRGSKQVPAVRTRIVLSIRPMGRGGGGMRVIKSLCS